MINQAYKILTSREDRASLSLKRESSRNRINAAKSLERSLPSAATSSLRRYQMENSRVQPSWWG
jgi:hypothetical protein